MYHSVPGIKILIVIIAAANDTKVRDRIDPDQDLGPIAGTGKFHSLKIFFLQKLIVRNFLTYSLFRSGSSSNNSKRKIKSRSRSRSRDRHHYRHDSHRSSKRRSPYK